MNDAAATPELGPVSDADLAKVRDEFHVLHEIVKRARVNLDRNTWSTARHHIRVCRTQGLEYFQ